MTPGAGPIWPYSKIVLNRRKKSFLLPDIFGKTKCIHVFMISMKPSTKMMKFMAPGSNVQAMGKTNTAVHSEHCMVFSYVPSQSCEII